MQRKILLLTLLATSMLVSCNDTSNSSSSNSSSNTTSEEAFQGKKEYQLEFKTGTLGLNSSGTNYKNAEVIGSLTTSSETRTSLKFSGGKKENYLSLPTEILNFENVTISYWTYVPYNIENKSCEFSFSGENNYFYSQSFDKDCWWAYNMSTNFNGKDECLTNPPVDSTSWGRTATSGVIEPIFNTWAHMSYVFTKDSFSVIKNGTKILEKSGDYNLKNKKIDKFYLGTSSINDENDFNGRIADFRVYSKALNEQEVKEEYDLKSDDFLTTYFEFDDNKEKIRNLSSTLKGNAKLSTIDEKTVLELDGSQDPSRSSLELANYTLHGHDKISISTDVFIKNTGNRYQRIFEFSMGGQRYLSLYVGFSNVNDLKLEFTNYANNYRDILLDSNYIVPTEEWINITFTSDGKNGSLYVDGNVIFSSDKFYYNDDTFWYYPDMHCALGKTDFYNDVPFAGYYDNFKIYACTLTEKEIMKKQGIITIDNDEEAVKKAYQQFSIKYDGGLKIDLPKYTIEGVKVKYTSSDENILGVSGYVYPDANKHEVILKATLSRGDYTMEKDIKITVNPQKNINTKFSETDFTKLNYEESSLYEDMMKVNIDYMFTLDVDRLLYNYRRIANRPTLNSTSYPGWISPTSNGAGQFETMYVGALARYTLSMPNYIGKDGSTPLSRLRYMINEMRACQESYAINNPQEKGYFGAIDIKCFKVIRNGGTALGDGTYSWVPYYMLHKNLAMALDVYTYVNDEAIKKTAKDILIDACDWVYQEVSSMSEQERNNVLNFEFGGMTEVLYKVYALTKNTNYIKAAHFFEQESLLNPLYNNINVLPHIHANTAIPKILGCASAYEATGDEYYKTIVINFYNMVRKMDYANGGLGINEFFEDEGITTLGNYSEETCCSYNMLKLTDYMFRWNPDSSLIDYFENIFYNQIMCSMDPATGGKTYPISTAFGYYKIYSTAETAFWCCCCTGQESFSKLTYGEYYVTNDKNLTLMVNLFNPMSIKLNDQLTVKQTGDILLDGKSRITIVGDGKLTLNLRVPSWDKNPTLKINGEEQTYQINNGYITIDREFSNGDYIDYEFNMSYHLDKQKGSENSYALFYGPFMLVCDLGNKDVDDIKDNQSDFGLPYDGDKVNYVVFDDHDVTNHLTKENNNGTLRFTMKATNQELEFIRFMDCYHQRYGMYLYYYFDGDNPSNEYLIEGEKVKYDNKFDIYKTNNSTNVSINDSSIDIDNSSEVKLISNLSLGNEFEIGATFKAKTSNEMMNSGIYLFAKNASSGQDKINALNVQIERNANSSSATVKIHKFNQAYEGLYNSCQGNVKVNSDGSISLRVIVNDGYLYVLANGSIAPIIKTKLDKNYSGGNFGLRSQFSNVSISNIYYIKK